MSTRRRRTGRFNFESLPNKRERSTTAVIQGFLQLALLVALIWLMGVSIRMVRAHFLEKYGFQAWILPLAIGLIGIFLIHRFSRFWAAYLEESREEKAAWRGK